MKNIILCMLLVASIDSSATTLVYKSFDDLIVQAEVVLSGTVTQVQAYKERNGELNTYVTLSNAKPILGDYKDEEISIRIAGGKSTESVLEVVGAPVFNIGDDVILFIKGNGVRQIPIVGWGQGVYRIIDDKVTDDVGNFLTGIYLNRVYKITANDRTYKVEGGSQSNNTTHPSSNIFSVNDKNQKTANIMSVDVFFLEVKKRESIRKKKYSKTSSVLPDSNLGLKIGASTKPSLAKKEENLND